MSKEEFNTLNNFILDNLKKENPFRITTSRLFSVINHNIQFSKGHNDLYSELLKYCEELNSPYNVKAHYKSEEVDKQFDIEFLQ